MDRKKNILTIVGISVLLIALVGATYAFFRSQTGGTTTRDVSVTSNTTDNLSFSISNDISFTVSTANFYQGGNNVSGDATATATLTPNNKTNQATMNYYMYLNLTSNPITYSSTNTNEDPELILQVFDGNDELVTLTGLGSQVALGNGYGYDITGQTGLITLLDNHTITANNGTATETWRVVITLVNLGVDQNDNGGKTVTGEIIMQKDEMIQPFCDSHPDDLMCYTMANYDATTYATGTTNLMYYHDENLEDGAEDGSYRYAGSNPNNYVCFGSNAASCPAENLYRIIGFMPVEVVTDSTTTPVTTETQMLYKLIRNDFETEDSIGMTKVEDYYSNPSYDNFPWSGSDSNEFNTWSESTLNTVGLNTNVLSYFGSTWSNKIATVNWKVGGFGAFIYYGSNNTKDTYESEIVNSGINIDNYEGWYAPTDNLSNYPAKLGLMYISDMLYSGLQPSWSMTLEDYYEQSYTDYSWIFKNVDEWSITRNPYTNSEAWPTLRVFTQGCGDYVYYSGILRRSFYLTKDTTIDRTLHAGTQADPYRVS